MMTPPLLAKEMTEFATDALPGRWQKHWERMQKELASSPLAASNGEKGPTLQEWLAEVYFDEHRTAGFTTEDMQQVGKLVGQLLKFQPGSRATARDVLNSPWFTM